MALRRHQVLIGYGTYLILRRVVRRVLRKKVAAAVPVRARRAVEAPRGALGSRLISDTRHAGGAMAGWFQTNGGRSAAGLGTLAPYAITAARDPEVQLSLSRAATAGRDAFERVSNLNPREALHAVAYDSRLHDRLGESARQLDAAVDAIGIKARKKRSLFRRFLLIFGIVAAVAGAAVLLKQFLGGDEGEELVPEIGEAPEQSAGAPDSASA